MAKYILLILVLLLTVSVGGVHAQQGSTTGQGNPIPPAQSQSPLKIPVLDRQPKRACVCNDDFRSCSSTCSATALDPSADTAGCSLKCCTLFKACLQIRGCASPTLECF